MDIKIILHSLSSFLIYLLLHILIFRVIDNKSVIKWLINVYILGGTINLISGLFILPLYYPFYCFISLICYSCLVYCYVLGIFGILDSSIRIKLLTEIEIAGNKGIRIKDIFQKYNREKIVQSRMKRFVNSGEMIKDNEGYYRLKKFFSYFILNNFIMTLMDRIYPLKP